MAININETINKKNTGDRSEEAANRQRLRSSVFLRPDLQWRSRAGASSAGQVTDDQCGSRSDRGGPVAADNCARNNAHKRLAEQRNCDAKAIVKSCSENRAAANKNGACGRERNTCASEKVRRPPQRPKCPAAENRRPGRYDCDAYEREQCRECGQECDNDDDDDDDEAGTCAGDCQQERQNSDHCGGGRRNNDTDDTDAIECERLQRLQCIVRGLSTVAANMQKMIRDDQERLDSKKRPQQQRSCSSSSSPANQQQRQRSSGCPCSKNTPSSSNRSPRSGAQCNTRS